MATYTVAEGDFAAHVKTLTPGTEDVISSAACVYLVSKT